MAAEQRGPHLPLHGSEVIASRLLVAQDELRIGGAEYAFGIE